MPSDKDMENLLSLISLVNERCKSLPQDISPEEWAVGLQKFSNENRDCWCADDRLDCKKLAQEYLTLGSHAISIQELLYYLSPAEADKFWALFCQVVGRDLDAIRAERQVRVLHAATAFAADMGTIGIKWTPEQAAEFVANNSTQISTRLVGLLQPPIEIPKADQPYFWSHFEKIYTLLFPYTPVPKGIDLGFFESCITEAESEGCQPQDMIAKLMTPETLGKVMQLLQNPEGLQSLMGTFLPLLNGGM